MDSKTFPVRFVEYGRFFQHVSINGLIMHDIDGNKLDADCRLEITSWPDSLNMIFYVDSKSVKPDKVILCAGTKISDNILRKQNESMVILALVEGGQATTLVDVAVGAKTNTVINVAHSGTYGAHIIRIRDTYSCY